MNRNNERIKLEIDLCCQAYGDENVFWPSDLSWVKINNVPLPPGCK